MRTLLSNKKVVFLFFTIIALFLTLTLSLFILFFSYSPQNTPSHRPSKSYQLTEINIFSSKHHRNRIVELPQNYLEQQEDYLAFSNEKTGTTSLITHLGGSRYECHGSCVCSPNRRSTTTVLSRGLTLLLSAFSSTMALQLAKDAFLEQCKQKFSGQLDVCSESKPFGVVDECEAKEEYERLMEDFDNDDSVYHCTGHCVVNIPFSLFFQHVEYEYERKGVRKFGECKELVLQRELTRDEVVEYTEPLRREWEGKLHVEAGVYVDSIFGKRYLEPFCRESSWMEYESKDKNLIHQSFEILRTEKKIWPWVGKDVSDYMDRYPYCIASVKEQWFNKGDPPFSGYKNVVCYEESS